jgi:hypothetical protein
MLRTLTFLAATLSLGACASSDPYGYRPAYASGYIYGQSPNLQGYGGCLPGYYRPYGAGGCVSIGGSKDPNTVRRPYAYDYGGYQYQPSYRPPVQTQRRGYDSRDFWGNNSSNGSNGNYSQPTPYQRRPYQWEGPRYDPRRSDNSSEYRTIERRVERNDGSEMRTIERRQPRERRERRRN